MPFGGPRHSRGTRATASPDRDGARLSASSLPPLRGSRHSSRFLRPGEDCRALSPLAVCLPRWLRSSRPGSFFPGHLGPLLSDARCRPHIPSDRPLPRLSTHSGAPTPSMVFFFFFGFYFLFVSFLLRPGEPFLGFGQIRPSQGPHPHPRRPRGQYPRTALSLPTAGKLRAFPFHSTFSAPLRPGWWEGEQGRARGGRPSPPVCVHLSQCPSAGDFPPGLFHPFPTPVAPRLQPDGDGSFTFGKGLRMGGGCYPCQT